MSDYDSDGDAESLFGSPPPSLPPARGTSPLLALPGCSGASNIVPKNVGTIALPGSHNSSELVVSLPASPPRPRVVHPRRWQNGSAVPHTDVNDGRAASVSAVPRKQVKPRRKTAKSATPGPVAQGPSFTLPDSSDPLPPNFLRNQQALLGLAGVVGGINPAHLSTRSSRGTSVQNPIIVEEEAPSISSSAWKARQLPLPAQMPLPSGQAVADALVSQGNIFPVLRSLLPYFGATANVGCCSGHGVHQFSAYNHPAANPDLVAPPLKRRKLNSIPAGAKDWDVPYPFPADEGPKHYLQTWERDRGKRLMMQLVSLVRDAVQKAAAKSYIQEKAKEMEKAQETPPLGDGLRHYRPSVINYGRDDVSTSQGVPAFLQGSSNSSYSPTPSPLPHQLFPDFLTSSDHSTGSSAQDYDTDFEALLGAVNNALNDSNVHLTDGDLAVMSSVGFSPTVSNSPTLTSSTRLPTPCDFTQPPTADNKETASSMFAQLQSFDFNLDDIPIDPMLQDLSWPPFLSTSSQNLANILLTTASSGAAMNENGEPAPRQAQALQGCIDASISTSVNKPSMDGQANHSSDVSEAAVSSPRFSTSLSTTTSQPSASTCEQPSTQAPAAQRQTQMRAYGIRFLSPITDRTVLAQGGSGKPIARKPDREDVLRRARVRREQLAAEVARAKIELWETTIEQGVLIHLSKDKSLVPTE